MIDNPLLRTVIGVDLGAASLSLGLEASAMIIDRDSSNAQKPKSIYSIHNFQRARE
jgi:hypothetical protein